MVRKQREAMRVGESVTLAPASVDSKGNQRVYVDLPRGLVQRFNVLAAMKGVTKRGLMTSLLTDAINRAASEAKV